MKNKKLSLFARVHRALAPQSYLERSLANFRIEQFEKAKITQAPSIPQPSETRRQRGKITKLREDARNVYRESAFAYRGVQTIVASTVGWGIEPTFTHSNPKRLSQIEQEWKRWSKSCTVDGLDFNSLQSSVMQSIVVDGEAVLKIVPFDNSFKFHEVNADFIADASAEVESRDWQVEQGIGLDAMGIPRAILLSSHQPEPGQKNSVKAYALGTEALHVFRRDRAGQVRGVSWLYKAIDPLRMLVDLQETHLNKQVLGSALTAVIKTDYNSGSIEQNNTRREELSNLPAGASVYLNPGESIELPSIPSIASEFDSSTLLTLREAAAGLGLFAEQLTQDWSKVNFSASKSARIEHFKLVDQWQWSMLVPRFLNPSMEVFKRHCALKGIDTTGLEIDFNMPAREMISPEGEVRANTEAIQSGQKSLKSVLKEYGINPKKHFAEIAETNKQLDELGLIFTSDARRVGNGQLASADSIKAIQEAQKNNS